MDKTRHLQLTAAFSITTTFLFPGFRFAASSVLVVMGQWPLTRPHAPHRLEHDPFAQDEGVLHFVTVFRLAVQIRRVWPHLTPEGPKAPRNSGVNR